MRKSSPKTPPSGLSSRLAHLPVGLLDDVDARRRGSKKNGEAHNGQRTMLAAVMPRVESGLASRMRLLEGFLSRTDIADCAQYGLQWLGEALAVPQAICLVHPIGEQSLYTVGSFGLDSPAIAGFAVS